MPPSAKKSASGQSTLSYENLAWILRDATRWRILEILAEGQPQMCTTLARRIGKSPGGLQKHLVVMREAGVLTVGEGRLNHIAPAYRPQPGSTEIDLGRCVLRFGARKPEQAG